MIQQIFAPDDLARKEAFLRILARLERDRRQRQQQAKMCNGHP